MNMANLQRLQQQMMQELGRIQEELKTATVEGSAGEEGMPWLFR